MGVVVTDNCRLCRFTECVAVCPVSCFHADDEMVYVDNDVCIDCRACLPACPVRAIYDLDELPDDKSAWISINDERAKHLPALTKKQVPLPSAEARQVELGF